MKRKLRLTAAWALFATGHLSAVFIVAAAIALAILPVRYIEPLTQHMAEVPHIWEMSTAAIALHVALSACVWAILVIVYKLFRLRREEQRVRPAPIRLSRGTVMTETLVILPIFFLLTFGMAQLAIINIGGILANVAAYQGARAMWIWGPEADAGRMGVNSEIAEEKCRIAVANVMLPVANGEFLNDPRLPTYAHKMRVIAVGSHIPFGGTLSSLSPEVTSLVTGGASLRLRVAVEDKKAMSRALDESSFVARTAAKFTHAFQASGCDLESGEMTYKLHIVMPLMGRVFGEEESPWTLSTGVGGRMGYFTTYTRDFSLPPQAIVPNPALPENYKAGPAPEEPNPESDVRSDADANADDAVSDDCDGC